MNFTVKKKMDFDGREELRQVLYDAGLKSVSAAVAKYTLFLHPETVKQSKNRNLFRAIRDFPNRGRILPYNDEIGKIVADDNNAPANTFRWMIPGFSYKDVQFNHIYQDSKNVELYTCMANLCVTPSFLAKLTDVDDAIVSLLKYRVYDLHGFCPAGESIPQKPEGYAALEWHKFPEPIGSIEKIFRKKLASNAKSRTALSAREIGWLFSDFKPDKSL